MRLKGWVNSFNGWEAAQTEHQCPPLVCALATEAVMDFITLNVMANNMPYNTPGVSLKRKRKKRAQF